MINILFLHAGAEMYGADKVLLDLVSNLDKSKYSVYVILPCDGILVEEMKKNGISVEVMPYPIMRRKYFNLTGIFSFASGFMKYSKMIAKMAEGKNIDIVHTNTAATLEGCFVSRKLKIPHLWSIHEIIVSPQIMFRITSRLIAKYSSIVIAVSGAVKKYLMSSGCFSDAGIRVIYNGVDSRRFSPESDCTYLRGEWGIPKDSRVIGMMGRINRWKGQGDFLKAANRVMAQYPDVYTFFVGAAYCGEEWREKELDDAIAKSPYRNRIINQGYRTDSESIFQLLDVFVLPSINPDPLPTVVLEAMATGKPVVGYRHGGICEMVEDGYNGFLADVCNPEELAVKIMNILEDVQLRKAMGEHSRKRLLERFSIEAYIVNYSNEYDRLTEKKRGMNGGISKNRGGGV